MLLTQMLTVLLGHDNYSLFQCPIIFFTLLSPQCTVVLQSPQYEQFFPPIVIVLMLILNFSSFSSNTKLLEIVVHTCLYLTLLITVSIHSRLAIMFKLNENCSYNSYQSPLTATQLLFMLLLCYFVADDTLTISYQGHLGP